VVSGRHLERSGTLLEALLGLRGYREKLHRQNSYSRRLSGEFKNTVYI
jgi:hypothetical protein